jgi:hypothetical protein
LIIDGFSPDSSGNPFAVLNEFFFSKKSDCKKLFFDGRKTILNRLKIAAHSWN